jgi:GH15 family glucan-1,4-alpha-glucosidase
VGLDLSDDHAAATFHLAAAATPAAAFELLAAARREPYDDQLARTVAWWQDWIRRAALPDTDNERVLEVCRRALINLKVGTDRESGAIVASIARQAPYGLDWPRDGAFFNAALDVAGYPEMVTAHQRFYLRTIRTAPAGPELFINGDPPPDPDDPTSTVFPAWSYEMNYYADGRPGGNIRFEIDNTALVVWSLVAHAGYLSSEPERRAYLAEIWPTLRNATDLLARWRDRETGLQAPANEDDNAAYTQTLHGAVTVYAALTNAARAARALGDGEALGAARAWERRARELRDAVLTHLYDEETGRFREGLEQSMNPQMAKAGPSAWLVWPARMLPFDDPRLTMSLRAVLAQSLAQLDPATGGGAYLTKVLVAGALALPDPADRADVEAGLLAMVDLVATADTAVLGETFVAVDTDGDGVTDAFSTRVANPHLWAATLVYLTAMALYNPERFDPHLEVLPPLDETGGSGCGCRATAARPGGARGLGIALSLLVVLSRGRQRRRRTHAAPPPRRPAALAS